MNYLKIIEDNGFAIVPDFLDRAELEKLVSSVQKLRSNENDRYASRDLLRKIPQVKELLKEEKTRILLTPLLGLNYFAVRGLFFNKVPAANWKVAWHQDVTIAVKKKAETPGFGPWSVKAGIVHTQAPNSLLANMLALRIHLDECGESNGPLKVIPGSHRSGRLKQDEIGNFVSKIELVSCLVPKGGILLMKPLVLHSSSPALKPANRRVIHIELAADDLPGGLEWFEKVS
jgi:ectoine hydroxylase-related dioxygenase (phytanoyl-CoA dioxygenase family)